MGKSEQFYTRREPRDCPVTCSGCMLCASVEPGAVVRVCAMCQRMCLSVRALVGSLRIQFSLIARLQHKGIFG